MVGLPNSAIPLLATYVTMIYFDHALQNGVVSGIPYLVLWGIMILTGLTADYIRKRRFMSTTMVRKVFNAAGERSMVSLLHTAGFQILSGFRLVYIGVSDGLDGEMQTLGSTSQIKSCSSYMNSTRQRC